jgi:glycosyltransferase involved in cell wall biosynthesis
MHRIFVDGRPLAHGYAGISRILRDFIEGYSSSSESTLHILLQKNLENTSALRRKNIEIIIEPLFFLRYIPTSIWHAIFSARLIDRSHKDATSYWAINSLIPLFMPKSVITIGHIHDFVFLDKPKTMTFFNYLSYKLFFKKSLAKASRLITTTHVNRKRLERYFSTKKQIFVVRPGVNIDYFHCSADKSYVKKQQFLYVGTLEPRKNISFLINLVQKLRFENEFRDFNLILIGKIGWKFSREELLLIQQFGWIKHYVNVVDSDLAVYYRQSKALLLCSMSEGYGMPVAEALASGTNVICTDIPELRESSQECGIYIPLDLDIAVKIIKKNFSDNLQINTKNFIIYSKEDMNKKLLKICEMKL